MPHTCAPIGRLERSAEHLAITLGPRHYRALGVTTGSAVAPRHKDRLGHPVTVGGDDAFRPDPLTARRWRRQRWPLVGLVLIPIAVDVGRTAMRGDWTADAIFWLAVLVVGGLLVVALPPLSRRRGHRRASALGAVFVGFAEIVEKPISPPDAILEALSSVHSTALFGRTAADRDLLNGEIRVFLSELRWAPGRIARDRGAGEWGVGWDEIAGIAIGPTPLAPRGSTVELRFVGGGRVTLQILDAYGFRSALLSTPAARLA
jgi:hypothetical protein